MEVVICDARVSRGAGVRNLPSWGHYVRAESPGATSITRTPVNRDATPPVQCWAKRADDFRRSPFLFQGQGLHRANPFFEYEMSRGLQVFSDRNKF
jgi:hypothetical protein